MNLIPQSKFKDLVGISKQAVSQLVKSGAVTSVKKGRYPQIDLDGALTQQYLDEKADQKAESTRDYSTGISKPTQPIIGDKRSYEIEKIREQIQEIQIKNAIKRGDLVEKKLIKKVFDRLYQIDQDELKVLGVNVSPKISAVYNSSNSEKVKEILKLIDNTNKELKSDISTIINSGETDRVTEVTQIIEDAVGFIMKSIQNEINKFLSNINHE